MSFHANDLRKNQTKPEHQMWFLLRGRRFGGLKFRRQKPIGPYIVDFCCAEKKIIVELDGGHHQQQQTYDERRSAYLQALGYRVVRFWNSDVLGQPEAVLKVLWKECGLPTDD